MKIWHVPIAIDWPKAWHSSMLFLGTCSADHTPCKLQDYGLDYKLWIGAI